MSSEMIYDLCIVGGGLFGSAAARHASANPTVKVCLIGAKEPTLSEKSNTQIFAAHYDEGRITRVLDLDWSCNILAKRSIERYAEIEKLSGIKFYTSVGCLYIGQKRGPFLQKLYQSANASQSPFLSLPQQDEAFRKRFPYLQLEEDEHAIFEENGSGYISPRKLAKAQKIVAEQQGCLIIEDVVCRIGSAQNGIHQVETEGKLIIKAKRILLSTGSFTNLKENAPFRNLSIKRYRETVVHLNIEDDSEIQRLSSLPSLIVVKDCGLKDDIGAYVLPIVQYPDGKYYLKYGKTGHTEEELLKTLEDIKKWYNSDGDAKLLERHLKLIKRLFPGLKYGKTSMLTCSTCHTVSGLPYIDRVTPTITVAVGGNGKGAKFSDEVGRIAATLATTGQWDSELNRQQFEAIQE